MEGSRLSRIGKSTLAQNNTYTLMQDISPLQFEDDRPINNQSTFFYDDQGEPVNNLGERSGNNEGKKNESDMYALPVSAIMQQQEMEKKMGMHKSDVNVRTKKKQNIENNQSLMQRTEKSNQSTLLNIKRPRRFRKAEGSEHDFLGDLYEVEDIISDISKIMEGTKRRVIEHEPPSNSQKPKWNNKFNIMSKLDEMLHAYKSTPDEPIPIPISDKFYRDSAKSRKSSMEEEELKKSGGNKPRFSGFSNFKIKNDNSPKLSFVTVKWNEVPLILSQWDPTLYLKLQSYPQNESYKKLINKVLEQEVVSYSIFSHTDAGIQSKEDPQNDKNLDKGMSLMSEEEYAKKWEETLQNADNLSESERESLMQFDIEWYRTMVEYVYHSGLEDLLEKGYDAQQYYDLLQTLKRVPKPSGELVLENKFKYLKDYFSQVYSYSSNQIVVGAIKLQNEDHKSQEELRSYFTTSGVSNFTLIPLTQNQKEDCFVLLLCLRNQNNDENIEPDSLELSVPNSNLRLGICTESSKSSVDTKILLKNQIENDWEVFMKVTEKGENSESLSMKLTEELLFGVVYTMKGIQASEE